MESLSERTKALIATLGGVLVIAFAAYQMATGEVMVVRVSVPIADGWGWLIPQFLIGIGLVVFGIRGVKTDTWPPTWW